MCSFFPAGSHCPCFPEEQNTEHLSPKLTEISSSLLRSGSSSLKTAMERENRNKYRTNHWFLLKIYPPPRILSHFLPTTTALLYSLGQQVVSSLLFSRGNTAAAARPGLFSFLLLLFVFFPFFPFFFSGHPHTQ